MERIRPSGIKTKKRARNLRSVYRQASLKKKKPLKQESVVEPRTMCILTFWRRNYFFKF